MHGLHCIDTLNAIDETQDRRDGKTIYVTYSSARRSSRDTDMLF